MNQYSPQPGLLTLRQAIARFMVRHYKAEYDPATEIIVTAGAQEALAAAFQAHLEPGDEVVMLEPFYPFMLGAIKLAGGIPKVISLQAPDFAINANVLEQANRNLTAR